MRFNFRRKLIAGLRTSNWPLVVVVVGFILFVPLYSIWLAPLSWVVRQLNPDPFASYRAAINNAAIKTPEYNKGAPPLATIDPRTAEVSVTAFKARPPQSPLEDDLWVSLPSELKLACAGQPGAARRLRQILGLPPTSEPRLVYEITVKPKDIFRPCISDQSPDAASCSMAAPKNPELPSKDQVTALPADQLDKLRKDYGALRQTYDDLRAVAAQMWDSYRIGFPQDYPVKPGDYPDKGFPFTGMGRTYDWRPVSTGHFGVTEFVVRKHAEISVKGSVDPETFCAK